MFQPFFFQTNFEIFPLLQVSERDNFFWRFEQVRSKFLKYLLYYRIGLPSNSLRVWMWLGHSNICNPTIQVKSLRRIQWSDWSVYSITNASRRNLRDISLAVSQSEISIMFKVVLIIYSNDWNSEINGIPSRKTQ